MQPGVWHDARAAETLAAAMAATATLQSRTWMRFFAFVFFLSAALPTDHPTGGPRSFGSTGSKPSGLPIHPIQRAK